MTDEVVGAKIWIYELHWSKHFPLVPFIESQLKWAVAVKISAFTFVCSPEALEIRHQLVSDTICTANTDKSMHYLAWYILQKFLLLSAFHLLALYFMKRNFDLVPAFIIPAFIRTILM